MVSKSVWNLPSGPWERLFGGVWNQFNVAVYENEDKALLTTIFPKSGEVSWIMIRVDKVLLIPKGIGRIEPHLKGMNINILKQQIPGKNMTYLILLNPPTTVDFGSKEIGSIVFQKVMSLNEKVDRIKDIAKKEKVEIIDLKDASYQESASVLGNPTVLLSLLSIAPEGEEPKKEKLNVFAVGESKEGLINVEEIIFEGFTSVKKGTEEERNYLAQVLAEYAIIDASPIPLIMDFSSCPLKLDQANPYPYDYARYGLESHNVGFKLEKHDLSEAESKIKINLNQASPQFIWKLFGIGTDDASTLVLQAVNKLQKSVALDNVESIEEEVKSIGGEGLATARALRMLRTIKRVYGDIFSKTSNTREMVYNWIKNNESVYLSMMRLDQRKKLAFMLYLLDAIEELKVSSSLSEIEEKRLDHILPIIVNMDWFGEGMMHAEIISKLIANHPGAIFVNEGELPMAVESRVTHRFHILGPRRAKLYIGGRGREFEVRPLLSCPP